MRLGFPLNSVYWCYNGAKMCVCWKMMENESTSASFDWKWDSFSAVGICSTQFKFLLPSIHHLFSFFWFLAHPRVLLINFICTRLEMVGKQGKKNQTALYLLATWKWTSNLNLNMKITCNTIAASREKCINKNGKCNDPFGESMSKCHNQKLKL